MDKRITCPICGKFKESIRKTCGKPECVSKHISRMWTDPEYATPGIIMELKRINAKKIKLWNKKDTTKR